MPLVVQHVLVTLAAIVAGSVVVRRVFTTVRPETGAPRCASCPAAQPHHERRAPAPESLDDNAQPLVLLRPTQR